MSLLFDLSNLFVGLCYLALALPVSSAWHGSGISGYYLRATFLFSGAGHLVMMAGSWLPGWEIVAVWVHGSTAIVAAITVWIFVSSKNKVVVVKGE